MLYLNTALPLWDYTQDSVKADGSTISCSSTSDGRRYFLVNIPSDENTIYASLEFSSTTFASNSYCTFFELILQDNTSIYFYFDGAKKNITLYYNGKIISTSYECSNSSWRKLFLKIDFVEGRIYYLHNMLYSQDISVDGIKGKNVSQLKCQLSKYSNKNTFIRNLIVSDKPISENTTLQEVPLSLLDTDWENVDNEYSTPETGKTINFSADITGLKDVIIKGAMMGFESSQSSNSIEYVKVNNKEIKLSADGYAIMTEISTDISKGISIES